MVLIIMVLRTYHNELGEIQKHFEKNSLHLRVHRLGVWPKCQILSSWITPSAAAQTTTLKVITNTLNWLCKL